MTGSLMKKEVLVLDSDTAQSNRLCRFLEKREYAVTTMGAIAGLDDYLETHACRTEIGRASCRERV